MKRSVSLLLGILLMLSFAACSRGSTRGLQTKIGSSDVFSQEDIQSAIEIVTDFFRKEFEGCTLKTLEYSEELTLDDAEEWAQQYEAQQAIVLISSFYVAPNGGDGSLNTDSTYENWQWILVRNTGENWTLKTWGY